MMCGWPNLLGQQCSTLIHTKSLRHVIGRLLQKSHSDWISKIALLHSDARALGSICNPPTRFGLDPHWTGANFLFERDLHHHFDGVQIRSYGGLFSVFQSMPVWCKFLLFTARAS
jgi:hypothetical protein